jgi:hypothetical protein
MGTKLSDHFFDSDPKKLAKLEDEAKEILRRESEPSKTNVFISFAEEDIDEVNLLRGQAKNENSDLEFRDYSVKEPYDSEDADYIRRNIREKIKQTSTTLIYLSKATAKSRWVNWEIEESIKLEKKVIGVYKGSSPPNNLPSAITKNKIQVVKWSHKSIMAEINK